MNENEFWVAVWRAVGLTFIGVSCVIAGCVSYESYVLSEALKQGADPMSISCAKPTARTEVVCALWVSKEKK